MFFGRRTALALSVAAYSTAAVADLQFSPETTPDGLRFVLVAGMFTDQDDVVEFRSTALAHKATAVSFNSLGGNILKAIELGRVIRYLGLDTIQIRGLDCASACAFAFLGGVRRAAEPGSIGVHRSWYPDSTIPVDVAVSAVQELTADVMTYIREMGADPTLVELSLRYDATDMRYLSGSEMAQYRVTSTSMDQIASVRRSAGEELSPRPSPDPPPGGVPLPTWRPPIETTTTTVTEPTPDPELAVSQKAIFYERAPNSSRGSAEPGSIVWSLVQESPGNDLPPEPTIHGEAKIPGKDVQLRLTIKRNAGPSPPASHIIEMIFLTPEGIPDGEIDNVLRVMLKGSEQEPGRPLMGIPAKISDGFFRMALNDSKAETDASLMRRQSWIDIWLFFRSGGTARLALEKGTSVDKVFDQALKAWAASPRSVLEPGPPRLPDVGKPTSPMLGPLVDDGFLKMLEGQ